MITTCRLCTKSCSLNHAASIFSFNRNRLILDLISIFCPIRIERADNLPQKICNSCLKLILDANELREKSVRSDYKLRQASLGEIESCEPQVNQNEDIQLEIGNEQAEVTEIVTVKQENPLQMPLLIKEVTTIIDNEELTNMSFLDEYCEDEDIADTGTGSDYAPLDPQPQKFRRRRFRPGKRIRSRNQPKTSKYEIIRGRYKCPMCHLTFSETPTIPKHLRKFHKVKDIDTVLPSNPNQSKKTKLESQNDRRTTRKTNDEKLVSNNLIFENDLNEASNESGPSTSTKYSKYSPNLTLRDG